MQELAYGSNSLHFFTPLFFAVTLRPKPMSANKKLGSAMI
jgi:hypothetical protein